MQRSWPQQQDKPDPGVTPVVNVAATWIGTRALGPGRRAVVWVQGCPFRCGGCIAPEWIPERPARLVGADALACELTVDPLVTGLTFSGGEPMLQATGLAAVVRLARRERDVSLVCFTGYRLERLRSSPPEPGVPDLLTEVDVLIDGAYVAGRNDGRGLRGSTNQRIHHLTGRLAAHDFAASPRTMEIALTGREALLIGIPPNGMLTVLEGAVESAGRRRAAAIGTPESLSQEGAP